MAALVTMRTPSMFTIVVLLVSAPITRGADMLSYTVVIPAPRYSFVAEPGALVLVCGPQTDGCTDLKGASFSGVCVPRGDGWRMVPSVSFIPYVYIGLRERRNHTIAHELAHIDDIRRSMERYVRRIAAMPFPSLEQCRGSADLERSRIADVMRSFAEASFEVRR